MLFRLLTPLKKVSEVTVTAGKLLEIAHFRAKLAPNLDVASAPAVTVTFFQETQFLTLKRSIIVTNTAQKMGGIT